MSRSIHATRAQLERERLWNWSDDRLHRKRRLRIARALIAKRSIKEEVRRERALAASAALAVPLDPDALPIHVVDQGELIHYPATEADLRAVLRALPPGSGDGLAEVELLLGRHQQVSARERDLAGFVRDPTGRLASDVLPGVFEGPCLGTYSPDHARIRLFAYVYDPALPDRAPLETYLKLLMLATFVHEVAHHVDHRTRVARGRWRADDEEKTETCADARQHEWVREIVVPYVARAHPEAVAELDRWLAERAGVPLPLELVADHRGLFHPASAFRGLVYAVRAGEPPDAVRVGFARELHYAEKYQLAHRVLDLVLAAEPAHIEARVLRAEILVREQRLADAEALVREVIARDERCVPAWRVLADLLWQRRAWRDLLETAERGAELSEPRTHDRLSFVEERARARLELGEYAALEADLAELATGAPKFRLYACAFRAIACLRTGRFAEALAAASEGLEVSRVSAWRHELLAARFEAARALDPSCALEPLEPATLETLRLRGFEDWAEKLSRDT